MGKLSGTRVNDFFTKNPNLKNKTNFFLCGGAGGGGGGPKISKLFFNEEILFFGGEVEEGWD